jgi:hypothetical protein
MVRIDERLNPLEVLLVVERLEKQGVKSYTLLPGNRCIWATYGYINEYYIFNEGKLVDIQID